MRMTNPLGDPSDIDPIGPIDANETNGIFNGDDADDPAGLYAETDAGLDSDAEDGIDDAAGIDELDNDMDGDLFDDDEDFDEEDYDEEDEATGAAASGERAFPDHPFRSGFVALVGRPNAGKSTLVNAIMGEKVVITSSTAQTTRNRISAIYNTPDMQIVLVDTPGLHKPVDALGEELNVSALNALKDVDIVAMVVDGSAIAGKGDEWVAQHVAQADAFKVLVITKADLIDQPRAQAQVDRVEKFCKFDDVIVLSAKEDFNVDAFVSLLYHHLPEGPRWFPEDMQTDQPIEVMIAEIIREKALRNTRDEVPHAIGVGIDSTDYDEKKNLSSIYATIYVERASQQGILVGAGGSMIRKIGTDARRDLERLLGNKVYLKLNVKVKENWRSDAAQIRRFGYGEGA
jgi:GTP-binding protein Era